MDRRSGNDILRGGAGNDLLFGGKVKISSSGGSGYDLLSGGVDEDR